MRYLATVIKKQMLGSNLLELHAKEVDIYRWVAANGEIVSDLANKFKVGTLVIAHLTIANQKLQRIEEAKEPIVRIFSGMTNFVKRYKDLEDDIEIWKQSMQYQIQELKRREEELVLRAEELNLELTCSIDGHHSSSLSIPESLVEFQSPVAN